MPAPALFDPIEIGDLSVANRIAMAPLTRSRANLEGIQSPFAAEYYRQRASAGLLITEATHISRQGHGFAYTPGIYTDPQVAAWRPVTEAVHAAGGKIVLQLMHVGRISHFSLQEGGQAPVAPSVLQAGDLVVTEAGRIRPSVPRALHTDEIPGVVADFRDAARRAKEAEFDGVEIHMANCFLLDQFLRDSTNHRDDIYGGSIENRVRLPHEVAQAVVEVWGAGRVGARISPVKTSPGDTPLDSDPQATYGELVDKLSALGIAYLHCIEGQTPVGPANRPLDFQTLRHAFRGAYIANGGYNRSLAIDTIAKGEADMIAFGRPFIGNPDLVERLRRDAEIVNASTETYYGGGAKGYTDFPTLGASAPV